MRFAIQALSVVFVGAAHLEGKKELGKRAFVSMANQSIIRNKNRDSWDNGGIRGGAKRARRELTVLAKGIPQKALRTAHIQKEKLLGELQKDKTADMYESPPGCLQTPNSLKCC